MRRWLPTLGLLCLSAPLLPAGDLTVLTPQAAGGPPRQMLTRYLKRLAQDALERRRLAYEGAKSPGQLAAYRQRLRAAFVEHLGGFPERTPLKARVVGALTGDRYRLEKVLFESQPRHHVTAVLFLPTAQRPPFPVVVMPCGHAPAGKVENQVAGAFLAQNGIACLCYDPIGQGERYQFLGGDGRPLFRPTTEHTLLGAGSIPLGRNTATYRIWDGIRAIDYLAGRKDLDAARVGVSGCSGGGTLTSYLMALDDRVACAAPSCYLTSLGRLLETIGPQDAEQNIHAQLAFGLDHADYLLLRAPRPTLILAATRDFFDIQGTWDTFRQAQRCYTRLGFGERVALVETDTPHGYAKAQREAMVRWMRRWLAGKDEPLTQPEIAPRPAADFRCTPGGQVMLLQGERSVVDLNVEENARLEPQRRRLWQAGNRPAALAEVRRLAGIRPLADLPPARHTGVGTVERDGYRIDKLVLETEPGIRLPALLFRPARAGGRRYLYLHGDGQRAEARPGGPIERLVQAGHVVLAVELRGLGETGPPALHAAALQSQLFASVRLVRSLPSWSDLVRHPAAPGQLVNCVHGALRAYDLPDLLAVLPRDRVRVEAPLDLTTLPPARGK
jgi:dienelactone hydrolase